MSNPRNDSLVINPNASRYIKPFRQTSPAQTARVIEMKIAGFCSAEILEETGVPEHKITRIWRDYRKANPSQPVMPKNHNTRRGDWK